MKSPTERTLKYLRDLGYTAEVVERRITMRARPPKPGARKRAPMMLNIRCVHCGEQTPSGFEQVTRDFAGFADIIAFKPGPPTPGHPVIDPWADLSSPRSNGHCGAVAVQVTSSQHLAERETKVRAEPRAKEWLASGNRILVIGWGLRGEQGKRKLWTATVQEITT